MPWYFLTSFDDASKWKTGKKLFFSTIVCAVYISNCYPGLGVFGVLLAGLTHCGLVIGYDITKLGQHWFRQTFAPKWCQVVTLTNTDFLLIGHSEINFNEMWIKMLNFSFNKINFRMLSAYWQPFCWGLNVLICCLYIYTGTSRVFLAFLGIHRFLCHTTSRNHCSCIDGLVQERCNSSALAMELRLSCTNPSIIVWSYWATFQQMGCNVFL